MSYLQEPSSALRQRLQDSLQRGDFADAEQCAHALLEQQPGDQQAARFAAVRHQERGELQRAHAVLSRAVADPAAVAGTWQQLALLQAELGDLPASAQSLRSCLELDPHAELAHLYLGLAKERLGEPLSALWHFCRAVHLAQSTGRWVSPDSTPAHALPLVKYAIGKVNQGRRGAIELALQPLRERYGASELLRVQQALAGYLGQPPPQPTDPRQQPKFLYFPGVPSQPYYGRERFPWQEQLEAATVTIREELSEVLAAAGALEPFLGTNDEAGAGDMLRGSAGPAAWDAYFFYRHGDRYDEHCLRCPRTTAVLEQLPLVRIREHAPESLFSVLTPGTHILPHSGVTNTRLVTHLPLLVPPDCALRVGGVDHQWQEGECITFDDTFVHEAWNRSERTRVVLILDSWNPDLTEVERLAVTDLVQAIGDFNRSAEQLAQ
jgi:aspartate beta-hydroxylase